MTSRTFSSRKNRWLIILAIAFLVLITVISFLVWLNSLSRSPYFASKVKFRYFKTFLPELENLGILGMGLFEASNSKFKRQHKIQKLSRFYTVKRDFADF